MTALQDAPAIAAIRLLINKAPPLRGQTPRGAQRGRGREHWVGLEVVDAYPQGLNQTITFDSCITFADGVPSSRRLSIVNA